MEENNEDFYDMLYTMKVEHFREVKERRLFFNVFSKMKAGLEKKAENFHKKTIYAKVFSALMLAHIDYI